MIYDDEECAGEDDCERSTSSAHFVASILWFLVPYASMFPLEIILMILLYCHVRKVEKQMRQYAYRSGSDASRAVAVQGLLYIGAGLVCNVPSLVINLILRAQNSTAYRFINAMILALTTPFQGACLLMCVL